MVTFINISYDDNYIYADGIDNDKGVRFDNLKIHRYKEETNLPLKDPYLNIYKAQWNLARELNKNNKIGSSKTIVWG